MDEIKSLIARCVDPGQQDLSKLQQNRRDNILRGRFCDKPLLITDGALACWGHDADQMKTILICKPAAHATAAKEVIPDNDDRRPTDCSRRI